MYMSYEELTNLVSSNVPVIVSIDIESKSTNVGYVAVVVDIDKRLQPVTISQL